MESKNEYQLLKEKLVALKAVLNCSIDNIENIAEHTWGELRSGRLILDEALEELESTWTNQYQVLITVKGGIAELVATPSNVAVEIRDFDNLPSTPEFTQEEIDQAKQGQSVTEEIAMIAAIISDHYGDLLYGKNGGYISIMETIVTYAKIFYQEFKDIDWEAALNDEYPPEKKDVFKGNNCWDDVIIQWAKIQLEREYS